MKSPKKSINPPQTQKRPGVEQKMHPKPVSDIPMPLLKLQNKIAVITGGDSGIGKSVALLYAKEGADVVIIYKNESRDANETRRKIEDVYGRQCLLLPGDISKETFCKAAIRKIIARFGRIDILVNNAGMHFESKTLIDITSAHLLKTFQTNIFSMFWMTQNALPWMKRGSIIINTSSVTAYRGSAHLIDYAATKGAIVSFTRSLSANLVKKGIRVNGVAPGPIWTPLIVSSFERKRVAQHGSEVPMQRVGEPVEVASCYVFLASQESSYISGQFLHPNGGEIING